MNVVSFRSLFSYPSLFSDPYLENGAGIKNISIIRPNWIVWAWNAATSTIANLGTLILSTIKPTIIASKFGSIYVAILWYILFRLENYKLKDINLLYDLYPWSSFSVFFVHCLQLALLFMHCCNIFPLRDRIWSLYIHCPGCWRSTISGATVRVINMCGDTCIFVRRFVSCCPQVLKLYSQVDNPLVSNPTLRGT